MTQYAVYFEIMLKTSHLLFTCLDQTTLDWVRQLEIAVRVILGSSSDYCAELVRIFTTCLGKSTFLLWDSFPDTLKKGTSTTDSEGQYHHLF